MKGIKDNFSAQADIYAATRPGYPEELFQFIYRHCRAFDTAWDCATGNGQAAIQLAEKFNQVYATDISQKQIDKAIQKDNIQYSISRAETTPFEDHSFDLVTIAQAIHWFDHEQFYAEVRRVCKEGALIAAFGYGLLNTEPAIQALLQKFYTDIVGPYWDAERKHVDNMYADIPFPFEEIPCPMFHKDYEWTLVHFTGYLNSWSSVRHYIDKEGINPVSLIEQELQQLWPEGTTRTVSFPIFMRLGRI